MNIVKEGTVTKVERRGGVALVHVTFDDGTRDTYQHRVGTSLAVGSRLKMSINYVGKAGRRAKLDDAAVRQAIKKLEGRATMEHVARELGVATRTLERWRARQGYDSWESFTQAA
jgi:hypothetical protein